MLRVVIVLAVIVIAMLRGGSLGNFARLRVRQSALVLGGLLLQLLIFPVVGEKPLVVVGTVPIYLLSMALLVWWVWLNRHLPGIVLIGAGVVMNLAALAANGGYMPVDPDAAAYAGNLAAYEAAAGHISNNSYASESGIRLWLLTDIFPVPAGIPMARVYSLGDILLTTGIGMLCFRTLTGRPEATTATKGLTDDHPLPAI
ncbi:MAG: DUF5317 domain-containing protein [Chloroflexales bacterium]|nr:DUF5317 domain-containing protein [Chloroflexales bacterium]